MVALQGFLLGIMVSWIPSVVLVGRIALGSAPEDRPRQQNLGINPRQQPVHLPIATLPLVSCHTMSLFPTA